MTSVIVDVHLEETPFLHLGANFDRELVFGELLGLYNRDGFAAQVSTQSCNNHV